MRPTSVARSPWFQEVDRAGHRRRSGGGKCRRPVQFIPKSACRRARDPGGCCGLKEGPHVQRGRCVSRVPHIRARLDVSELWPACACRAAVWQPAFASSVAHAPTEVIASAVWWHGSGHTEGQVLGADVFFFSRCVTCVFCWVCVTHPGRVQSVDIRVLSILQ